MCLSVGNAMCVFVSLRVCVGNAMRVCSCFLVGECLLMVYERVGMCVCVWGGGYVYAHV